MADPLSRFFGFSPSDAQSVSRGRGRSARFASQVVIYLRAFGGAIDDCIEVAIEGAPSGPSQSENTPRPLTE